MNVLITGAGLAGCHSARALAERGHQVMLFDVAPNVEYVRSVAGDLPVHQGVSRNLRDFDRAALASRAALPSLLKQGGAIVNVGSISGFQGLPVAHTYTAAKGAMHNLTRSLCVTYAKDNIRTNCIAPGIIDTPMVASILNMFDDDDMADRLTPMKRPGSPEEMALGCLYLGSDEASYCNGTILTIDGGTTARQ